MKQDPDPFGRDATQPLLIPSRGWWQVVERVYSESVRDNLSVVAAGCAFYALLAIFPALSALISLYGLAADPANVAQNFGMLAYVLPNQAYDIVIDQIRRVAEASEHTLGWSLLISLGLALWSANAGAQAMFTALNIAYEEPERRSLFHFYLSALTFTVVGIFGALVMLIAIVYVPILFTSVGFSREFEFWCALGAGPFSRYLCLAC
jgi:membrane protein